MDTPEPLRDLMAHLQAARLAGDAAAIAACYAEDGLLILPDGRQLRGRAAIGDHYRAAQAVPARRAPAAAVVATAPAKFFFFPPVVHALSSVNGRHGEKHSFVDIMLQQADGSYLLACSSSTLR